MIGVCLKYMMRNYGSQLQARATVKAFEDLGLEYEIIEYKKKGLMHKIKALPRLFNPVVIDGLLLARQKKKAQRALPMVGERNKLFDKYSSFHFSSKTASIDYFSQLQQMAEKYDAVITCSDQLWSPAGLGTNFYNLMFVPDNVRKVSWASSFGVSQIPWYQKKATKRFLQRIEYVSMRENQGADIVKKLTGRDVPVLMDPVFIYSKEEWENIIPSKKEYDFPYILCYFLGENEEYRKRVDEFAKKHNIKIVAINFCNSFIEYDKQFGDVVPYDVDPDRFLNLLRGAEYVCTDSFHGAAFSIIMEKQFAIFNRYSDNSLASKNSRIDSLCTNLDFHSCRANANSDLDSVLLKPVDYSKVKANLEKYIMATKSYLQKAFEGVK